MSEYRENNGQWSVTDNGFEWDSCDIYTWTMQFDETGNYVSQTQENMMWTNKEDPMVLTFSAELIDGVPCVNGKPVDSMSEAEFEMAKG